MSTNTSDTGSSRRDYLLLAGFIALCAAVSAAGGAVTASSVGGWYQTLAKPPFNPPDWLFGPVWTVLYLFIAIAGWRLWRGEPKAARRTALALYFAQLAVNLAWSFLFFGAQMIGAAFIDIAVLVLLIGVCIVLFRRVDRWAALLFVPYGLWVAFATVLNGSLWLLN